MTELADVLEVMHNPGPRFHTLQANGRAWRHRGRHTTAFRRATPDDATVLTARGSGPAPSSDEEEEPWKVWAQTPERMRAEFKVGNETVNVIFHGDTWWGWSPSQAPRTNGGRTNYSHGGGPGAGLLDPSPILSTVELEVLGRTTVLGRSAYRVRAVPVVSDDAYGNRIALHHFASGSDEYEFLVDADGGFLLRTEARLGGEAFYVIEMTDLAVDSALPDGIFDPPASVAFDESERIRHPQLADVPRLVDFTVFVFEQSPGGFPFVVMHSRDPDRGTPPTVMIIHSLDERGGNLWLTESGEPMPADNAVGQVWREEDEFRIGELHVGDGTTYTLQFERDGTYLRLSSAVFSTEELVGLARRLLPMPTDPPRLVR